MSAVSRIFARETKPLRTLKRKSGSKPLKSHNASLNTVFINPLLDGNWYFHRENESRDL